MEWNNAVWRNMGGSRHYHTELNRSDREGET